MFSRACHEHDVQRTLSVYLDRPIHVQRILESSSGNVFLLEHKTQRWVAKFFSPEKRPVVTRTIHVLRVLASSAVLGPRLVCDKPIPCGHMYGYVYQYVNGICLRDIHQSNDMWLSAGRLIAELTCELRRYAVTGSIDLSLFDTVDLERGLEQGCDFIRGSSIALYHRISRLLRARQASIRTDPQSPIHADLHTGNLILTNGSLVPVDFDSMYVSVPEKAFASLIGKAYEIPEASTHLVTALIEAVVEGAERGGLRLHRETLRLHTLLKKIGELRYLNTERVSQILPSTRVGNYRADAVRGLLRLLSEWEQFPNYGFVEYVD